jgi:hypothetical protein
VISPLQGRHLLTEQHKQNKCTQCQYQCLEWDSNTRSKRSRERIQ